MKAEIVSIGTELLLGEIVDTNSAHIARQLRDIGVTIHYITTVGDNRARIADAVRVSLARADVVITTGGLGPTVDDMTRQAVADATNRDLEFRPELLQQIADRFWQLGARMSENNRVQAYIPAGATPLHNRMGTAPCYIVEAEHGTVISLPGVPREMKALMESAVLPYLRKRMGGVGVIKARILRTAGIGESQIDEHINDLETWSNPTVGLAAHTGQTDIRITARANTEAEADVMIAEAETIIRARLGAFIYGVDKEPLEDVFVNLLRENNLKLAVSYTGALETTLRERLHLTDGIAEVLIAEVYDTELETLLARLGPETTREALDFHDLAKREAARLGHQSGADVVIAIVTHEGGTGITAWTPDNDRTRRYSFGGAETEAPLWSGTWGMSMAWRLVRQMVETRK